MYSKILVPLDGSPLAECVLPHVQAIAAGCGTPQVILLRVVSPFRTMMAGDIDGDMVVSPDVISEIEEQSMREATTYMDGLAKRFTFNPPARVEVVRGVPAEVIADYASKQGVDLIVIATHGRSGVKRLLLGSVADRVVRSSCVPVLMVRAPGCIPGI